MKTKTGKSLVLLLTAAMIITLANVNYVNAASKKIFLFKKNLDYFIYIVVKLCKKNKKNLRYEGFSE